MYLEEQKKFIDIENFMIINEECLYNILLSNFSSYMLYPLREAITNDCLIYFNLFSKIEELNLKDRNIDFENLCFNYLTEYIHPIFELNKNYYEKFINDNKGINEFNIEFEQIFDFIKNIKNSSFKELCQQTKIIEILTQFLFYHYNKHPFPSFLQEININLEEEFENIPQFIPTYDMDNDSTYFDKNNIDILNEDSIYENQKTSYSNYAIELIKIFNYIFILNEENSSKLNDFIIKKLKNLTKLDFQFFLSALKLPTYVNKSKLYIYLIKNLSILLNHTTTKLNSNAQEIILEFLVYNECYNFIPKTLSPSLYDYICKNHIALLKREPINYYQLTEIILRNSKYLENIESPEQLNEWNSLLTQTINFHNNELDLSYAYIIPKYDLKKLIKMINQFGVENKTIRPELSTMTNENIVKSCNKIQRYIKNNNIKTKTTKEFNKLFDDTLLWIVTEYNDKENLINLLNKVKTNSLKTIYSKELKNIYNTMETKIDEYKKEFEKIKAFSFEKYYKMAENNIISQTYYYKYLEPQTILNKFNELVSNFKGNEIKNLLATNEYFYNVQLNKEQQGFELTPFLVCIVKSIEQLMCACIEYAKNQKLIKEYYIEMNGQKYFFDNPAWYENPTITGAPLKTFLIENVAKNSSNNVNTSIINQLDNDLTNWIKKIRNGHFHKDNIYNFYDIKNFVSDSYKAIGSLIVLFIEIDENK